MKSLLCSVKLNSRAKLLNLLMVASVYIKQTLSYELCYFTFTKGSKYA